MKILSSFTHRRLYFKECWLPNSCWLP